MEHFFNIRNFYGERVCYYFLWLKAFIQCLTVPSIIGLIFFALKFVLNTYERNEEGKAINGEYIYEILILVFIGIIGIWGASFMNYWSHKEELYNYSFGTENYSKQEPYSELFVPDKTEELIFNRKFPTVKKWKKHPIVYIVAAAAAGIIFQI